MHYYIDGYNLMFRIARVHDDLSAFRQQLIEQLYDKIQDIDIDITIVFDAHYQAGESSRTHFQHMEIVFTEEGESADDRILEEIKAERYPRRITVVTSDKKLAWFARRCSAKTESVEDFLYWLNKRHKNRLRQKKQAKLSGVVPRLIEPKPLPKKSSKPASNASPEQCGDYYLDAFQKEFAKIEASQPPPKAHKPPKQRKKPKIEPQPENPEDKALMDMERWLNIFERKLHE